MVDFFCSKNSSSSIFYHLMTELFGTAKLNGPESVLRAKEAKVITSLLVGAREIVQDVCIFYVAKVRESDSIM